MKFHIRNGIINEEVQRMKKRRNILIVTVIVIVLLTIMVGYFLYRKKKDININFIENKVIEYGDKQVTSKSFVKTSNGSIIKYPVLDTMKTGKIKLIYTVEKNSLSKKIEHEVEVKDTRKPTIHLKQNKVTLNKQQSFDLKSNIVSVKDEVDGNIPYKTKLSNHSYTIKSNFDNTKEGTYNVKIIAKDKHGNTLEKGYQVIVKASNEQIGTNADDLEPYVVDDILLVNKKHGLPKTYGGLDNTAYKALQELIAGANSEGIAMPLLSGYRSYETQEGLYNAYVQRDGQEEADRYSARAGYSEHQTGLSFDVGAIDNDFGKTTEGKWLTSNCATYGFILRYLEGKESITGYMYEPWHIRYVGKDVAKEIMAKGITLEEYLGVK